MSRISRSHTHGFTLVENLVALAVLAGALVALGGVLVEACRLVAIGRRETIALAVARGIAEDLGAAGFEGVLRELGLDGTGSTARVDVRAASRLAAWQSTLGASLGRARAEVELVTVAPATSASLGEAHAVRIVVTVTWAERARERSVRLAVVRT